MLGRRLAEARNVPFLDLDEVILEHEGRTAADLITEDEQRFRRLERETLSALAQDPRPAVIATGGGCEGLPNGIRTIWIHREGWEESALRERKRLRPQLSPEDEVAWMKRTRDERYRRAAHLCLHIERGCGEEAAAQRLILLAEWLAEAAGSPGLKKSWIVPRDAEDLPRAEADVRLFELAGVEIRSDLFSELPEPDIPWMASLRTEDPTFFQRASRATAFDCEAGLLRFLDLHDLDPKPLVLSIHPDDVYKEYFDFLTGLPVWIESSLPAWHTKLMLKYAPRVKSWVELRYANQLHKVFEKTGNRLTFLPQGKNWKWMRVQRLFNGNDLNYLSTGCLEHSHRPPSLDYFLPHVSGPAARDFYGVIGNTVEHSIGDIFHRAMSLKYEGGAATYVKIPLTAPEIDNCLHLLPQIGFKGLSVTSPLKSLVGQSNFVGSDSGLAAGNTLSLVKGSFLLFDTDEEGMDGALSEIESDGLRPGPVVIFGSGGVTAAITRALISRNWGPISIIRARDGWPISLEHTVMDPAANLRLVVDASGGDSAQHLHAPACAAWLDLRYRDIPPPPAAADRYYNGRTFYRCQAMAQRRIWGLGDPGEQPLL